MLGLRRTPQQMRQLLLNDVAAQGFVRQAILARYVGRRNVQTAALRRSRAAGASATPRTALGTSGILRRGVVQLATRLAKCMAPRTC